MLLRSLARIVNYYDPAGSHYQYVGFGGLAFTDYKLFHKELGIDKMISIEKGPYNLHKLNFNKPFSCIEIKQGESETILPQLTYDEKTIAWLDYDGVLDTYMFHDTEVLIGDLPEGSVFIMSCNYKLTSENADTPFLPDDEFKSKFGDLVPYDVKENCCSLSNAPGTFYQMFKSKCNSRMQDRNIVNNTHLKFLPLYYFTYNDGAPMFTFGGAIVNDDVDYTTLHLSDFEFINKQVPYNLDMPNFTFYELNRLNQAIGDDEAEKKIIREGILQKGEIDKFRKFYKYMPNFFDVSM